MSAPECCIKSCENKKVAGSKYSFHHLRFDWTLKLQGALKDSVPKKLICSKHFKPELVIERNGREFLVPNAVPTLFLTEEKTKKKPEPEKKTKIEEKPLSRPSPVNFVFETTKTPKYEDQFEKHHIKKCSIRWKNIKLKCAGPNCGLIESSHVFVAQIGDNTVRPRYIILCKRHRDITKPETYDYLSTRLGNVISLRKNLITIDESENEEHDEDNVSLRSKTMSPVVVLSKCTNKRNLEDEHDKELTKKMRGKSDEKGTSHEKPELKAKNRTLRSSGPALVIENSENLELTRKRHASHMDESDPDETIAPQAKKTETWRDVFKPSKKSKTKRGRPFGSRRRKRPTSSASESISTENDRNDDSNEPPSVSPIVEDPPTTLNVEKKAEVISLDDSDSSDEPNSSNILRKSNCSIPGCKSTKTDAIIKIGEAPNFEYLVVCAQHRDCLKNVQAIQPINKTPQHGEYILEEGEVPPSPPTPEDLERTFSNIEKMNSSDSYCIPPPIVSSPMRGESVPVQRVRPTVLNSKDPIELNAQGNMLVSRKCISMTGPSGVPKSYILEEWGDGSIIYTPAPPGLPLGSCTKEQVAFYKMRGTQASHVPAPLPSTSTASIDCNQILSMHHIQPAVSVPSVMPTADVSKSELVYIQGKPFLLTSIQGLGTSAPATPAAQVQQQPKVTQRQRAPQMRSSQPIRPETLIKRTPNSTPTPVSSAKPPQPRPSGIRMATPVSNQSRTNMPVYPPGKSTVGQRPPQQPKSSLVQKIQTNVSNRIASLRLPKSLTVRLQQSPTNNIETNIEDEPEEILSDTIRAPVPVALTRIGQGPSQSVQISQNVVQKANQLPIIRDLTQKTTTNQPKSQPIVPKRVIPSISLQKTTPTTFKYTFKPTVTPQKPVVASSSTKVNQKGESKTPQFVVSEPRTISKQLPTKPVTRRSESPPPVRVTRLSSQNTPPKVQPEKVVKANSINESNVIKIINLNTDTSAKKILKSEPSTPKSSFSLPVTSIAAINSDDDESSISSRSDKIDTQHDSDDPLDPLSVKAVATIDLDEEADPLGDEESVTTSSSGHNTSSNKSGSTRHGSLPFPSSIRKPRTAVKTPIKDSRSSLMQKIQFSGRKPTQTPTNKSTPSTSYHLNSRFFEVSSVTDSLTSDKKFKSLPVYFCEPCDILFSTAMRYLSHAKICTTKDQKKKEKDIQKIYICKKCQRTSLHPFTMFTHVRRCNFTPARSIFEASFTCGICHHSCASLGEMDAHFELACPYLTKIKQEKRVSISDSETIEIL